MGLSKRLAAALALAVAATFGLVLSGSPALATTTPEITHKVVLVGVAACADAGKVVTWTLTNGESNWVAVVAKADPIVAPVLGTVQPGKSATGKTAAGKDSLTLTVQLQATPVTAAVAVPPVTVTLTGKVDLSQLKCLPEVTFTDQCKSVTQIKLWAPPGEHATYFLVDVSADNGGGVFRVEPGKTKLVEVTKVSATVRTGLMKWTHDWKQPASCASASPSASLTRSSTPAAGGLPVTGGSTALVVAVALGALLSGGVLLLLGLRRRRTFTA